MGTGDRPIFPLPNQRLDKKDLNFVSTFIQETINRSLGSIFSGNGGLLSKLEYSLSYNSPTEVAVSFLAFRAAWSAPLAGDPSVYDGGVMTYDPTRPAQVTSSWPIEAFAGQATTFWAKRYASSNAVVDNRAYWQGGTKYAATQTVESEYVEIVPRLSSAGPPDAEFRWVQIAYIQAAGWSGFTPTIKGIYFPDSKFFPDGAGPSWANWWSLYDPGGGALGYGLGDQIRWIFNVLSRFNDSDWVFLEDGRVSVPGAEGWQDAPTMGLSQIADELADVDTRLDVLEAGVTEAPVLALTVELSYDLAALPTPVFTVRTIWSNSSVIAGAITVTRGTGHGFELTLVPFTGFTIYSITAQSIQSPLSAGDAPTVEDSLAILRLRGAEALPTSSLIICDGYTVAANTGDPVDTVPMIINVFVGRTP